MYVSISVIILNLHFKIFCVHGGIPHPAHGGGFLSAINDIPSHLPNPVDDSPLAWDIMWNDPVR